MRNRCSLRISHAALGGALEAAQPRLLLAAAFLLFPGRVLPAAVPVTPGSGSGTEKCTLRVHATGFRSQQGVAGGVVFSSPDGWPENVKKAYASNEFPITGDHALLSFELPPGEYAVAVLHDKNEDQKLDRNILGIPEEGFGFANNPDVFLKAPSFEQAAILVGCPVTDIQVHLIHKLGEKQDAK